MSHPTKTTTLHWGAVSTGSATALARLNPPGFSGAASLSPLGQPAPFAGILRSLHVLAGTGPVLGVQDFRVYKNGVVTALGATLVQDSTTTYDETNAVVVSAGDNLELRGETAAGVTGALNVSVCVHLGG